MAKPSCCGAGRSSSLTQAEALCPPWVAPHVVPSLAQSPGLDRESPAGRLSGFLSLRRPQTCASPSAHCPLFAAPRAGTMTAPPVCARGRGGRVRGPAFRWCLVPPVAWRSSTGMVSGPTRIFSLFSARESPPDTSCEHPPGKHTEPGDYVNLPLPLAACVLPPTATGVTRTPRPASLACPAVQLVSPTRAHAPNLPSLRRLDSLCPGWSDSPLPAFFSPVALGVDSGHG